jgi:hypothetical protein
LETAWKEAVLVSFDLQFRLLVGGTEENHKKVSQDTWSAGPAE